MTSDKKTPEIKQKATEKKQKSKKIKTDPNLFLFNDVVDDNSKETNERSEGTDKPEISDISELGTDNEIIEDIDTPSYLRKGSNQ